jgi:hypothetical protein
MTTALLTFFGGQVRIDKNSALSRDFSPFRLTGVSSVKATLTCQTAKITKSSQHFRSSGPCANRWKRNGAGFLEIAAF